MYQAWRQLGRAIKVRKLGKSLISASTFPKVKVEALPPVLYLT